MKTVRLTFTMRLPKALERPACRTGASLLNDATRSVPASEEAL